MKPVQIVLLVIAGALGGALWTRTWNKPKPAPAVTAEVQPPATAPAPSPAPAAETPPAPVAQAPAAPVNPEPEPVHEKKPSPAPRRASSKPRPVSRPVAPPPANPRPVEIARVEPPPPAVEKRPEPAPAPVVSTPPARPEPEHETPAPPPPPVEPNRVTLNAGTLLPVRLIDGLTSERNAPGDTFTGTLDHELVVDGFVIAERGARVEGRVVDADRGGKVKGVSFLSIELTRIHTSDGQAVAVQTDPFERRAEASYTSDAAKVGGGAALGAIIGAIAGGGKGAAIGAAAGGGAGAGTVLMTRGKPVTLSSETRINFRMRAPVTITERQ